MQIKLRAWDKKRNKMWSAEELGRDELTLNPDGRGFVNVSGASTKLSQYMPHLIPLQFIGLKDNNRNEIYGGDILKFGEGKYNGKGIGQVVWNKTNAGFYIKNIGSFKVPPSFEFTDVSLEVIGNIYKNPELLKK